MKHKKHNPFLTILFILFIVYISLFIATESGYYERKRHENVTITAKNMQKFEEDVKNNKNVDIYNYVEKDKKDYRGFASNMGDSFSNFIEKMATEELVKVGKVMKKMFS